MYCKECVERNKSLSNNNVVDNNLRDIQGANVCYKRCVFCGRIIDSGVDVCNFCLQNDFNSDKYREKRNNLNGIKNVFWGISAIVFFIALYFSSKILLNDVDYWPFIFIVLIPMLVVLALIWGTYYLIKDFFSSPNNYENTGIIKNSIYIGLILLVLILFLVFCT